jgi:hypothetical protein
MERREACSAAAVSPPFTKLCDENEAFAGRHTAVAKRAASAKVDFE